MALNALTLTLNTLVLYKSTLRRFEKVDYTTYSIVQFFMNTPSVRPPSEPLKGLARCRFFTKPIISVKVLLPFQRTYLSCTLGNAGHTTTHNTVYKKLLVLASTKLVVRHMTDDFNKEIRES